MSKSLEQQINDVLRLYNTEVNEAVEKAVDEVAKEGQDIIKQTIKGKINSKKYIKSIRIKKNKDRWTISDTIYASGGHYRLTHLLEHGHAIANQYGTYTGKTREFPHWKYGEEHVIKELEKRIVEGIEGIK